MINTDSIITQYIRSFRKFQEAVQEWDIAERTVRKYCEQGGIKGAIHAGSLWVIPMDAVCPNNADKSTTPHSCRHTYVSQLQALGVDLQTIQSIVGHADVDMTEHYLHVQEPKRLEAVDLFSKAFGIPTD